MNANTGQVGRLLAILLLLAVALVGTGNAAAAAPTPGHAIAAAPKPPKPPKQHKQHKPPKDHKPPYGHLTTTVNVAFSTNAQGQEVITITITGRANRTIIIVLHSRPTTLGTMTLGANGTGDASFRVPAGFTGAHTVELVDSQTGELLGTSGITLPAVGSGSGMSVGTTAGTAAGTASNGTLAFTGVAVIGLGALALALLAAGGALLVVGRRRVARSIPLT